MFLHLHSLHIYYGFIKDFDFNILADLLTADEKKRAHQFKVQNDQHLHIASRVFLRRLLAAYLNMEASQVQFEYGINGKPFAQGEHDVQFNVAHSNEVFLLGFVKKDAIGIDIEHLSRPIDTKKISAFLFSENELEKFQNADQTLRHEQFINCWTRKEAFVKAKGVGLSFPLKQLEVSFVRGEKAKVVSTMWHEHEQGEWFLESLDIPGNYRGAVAIQGKIESIEVKNILECKWLLNETLENSELEKYN